MKVEVDEYIDESGSDKEILNYLRGLLIDQGLSEDWKWRQLTYTHQGKNIVILGRYKGFVSISFLKGSLMKDGQQLLEFPGPNSRSAKWLKISSLQQAVQLENVLKEYVEEAVELEKKGIKVAPLKTQELIFPKELDDILDEDPELKLAFDSLTPGRKRAYHIYWTGAKQSKTITSRIQKHIPRIKAGKGPNDCICGLSRRMPNCDGSHKQLNT
jgi:uncharacterized protein YdeI (YjbR/CyaY-like superfamily)